MSAFPQAQYARSQTGGEPLFEVQNLQPSTALRSEALTRVLLAIGEYSDLGDLLTHLATELHAVLRFDVIGLCYYDEAAGRTEWHLARIGSPVEHGTAETKERTTSSCTYEHHEFPVPSAFVAAMSDDGMISVSALPLIRKNRTLGVVQLGRREYDPFSGNEKACLMPVAQLVSMALENALARGQIAGLKEALAQEKLYFEGELSSDSGFEKIVGHSPALRQVLRQIETVAPTDSTVLICGETGTGKELIARAIHERSPRGTNNFVKLHCAAIPSGLLESELFGHEKGAFTGAIARQVGRFELASNGTAFLDEVGEIPLELQPKLLRVLQEREFERLGSSRTLRTNVRLIAATNRDLQSLVEEQQFRSDLFYRLNVFPIHVPPLRERREDIPLLVRHFVQHLASRMNKAIDTIPSKTMEALCRYRWPGNIRELENVIERAVILSSGPELQVPLRDFQNHSAARQSGGNHQTLEEVERAHIVATLKDTQWVLAGPKGAAARLGLNRSTLQFRMKKLGILRSVQASFSSDDDSPPAATL